MQIEFDESELKEVRALIAQIDCPIELMKTREFYREILSHEPKLQKQIVDAVESQLALGLCLVKMPV